MLEKNLKLNLQHIKENGNGFDYKYREINIANHQICLVFIETIVSSDKINDYILKTMAQLISSNKSLTFKNIMKYCQNILPGVDIKEFTNFTELENYIHNSYTIILFNNHQTGLAIETKAKLDRGVNTPTVEQSISGPKDSFNENIITNIGLVRKRIKTDNLTIKEFIVGRDTKTKVALLYMKNIAENSLIQLLENKIQQIDIDGILDSGSISEIISDSKIIFPVTEATERPDLTSLSLLDGKVIIMVENSPNALIMPTFFVDFFHNPEDNYQKWKNVSFIRLVRFFSFMLAVLTPALYIAITTYNQETIPTSLLINFAAQRENVPFPAIIEALGMTLIFEVLRESDIRMPNQMGSAIGILGAIILGDAAVTAGIVSPIMVIVIAITAISGLIFSHVILVNAIRLWRIIFMLFATILGMPGVIFCSFLFIMILASADSFGKPYLYPFAPLNQKMLNDSIVKASIFKLKKRNPLLTDKNFTRSNL